MRSPLAAAVLALLFSAQSPAQQNEKKAFVLRGTVEQVNAAAKRLSVANEAIPGGMGAMTMTYSVDKEDVLGRLKKGDRIKAKFYEGDMMLYDVEIEHPAPSTDPQPKAGMHLEEFERMALQNNPTLAQTQANVRVSAGLARQAGLYPNPTVGYYGDEIRGGYYGGGKQGGFISQTIVMGGKLGAARRVAQLASKQAETSGAAQRLQVLNNVRIGFYQVLAAQRLVEVRQNLTKLAADATQTSHQLANVGQADRPDVLQTEVEEQQAIVNLRVAQQALRSAWAMLAAVSGKPALPQTSVEGDLEAIPDLNYEEWLATTLKESPELTLAQQAVERAEASVTQARKAPIPDLQLYGNLAQNFEPLETTHKPVGVNAGVQIGLTLPVFNRNQGNIAAAKAGTEEAKAELERVKLQIARNFAGSFRDYDSARTTVRQFKTRCCPGRRRPTGFTTKIIKRWRRLIRWPSPRNGRCSSWKPGMCKLWRARGAALCRFAASV